MRDLYDVIVAPVVTEKATREMEEENVYTFLVHPKANKGQIADAVELNWDVEVEDVRTMRYQGDLHRALLGRMHGNLEAGRRNRVKKAIVRLTEGDHIEYYEAG